MQSLVIKPIFIFIHNSSLQITVGNKYYVCTVSLRWMKPKKPGLIPTLSNTFLSCLLVSHTNSDSPLICIRHQLDTCSNLTQDFHSGHGLCPKWNQVWRIFFPKPNQAFLCLNLPKVQFLIKHVAFWQEGLLCYTKMLRGTLCVYTRHWGEWQSGVSIWRPVKFL